MVAQFTQSLAPERKQALIAALQNLPYEWALTPVNGNKQPYRKNWQRKGMACQQLIEEIRSDRAKGFGLLTGVLSGGILAIDADGEAAHELLAKHGELPRTVAFKSGRPGRCQYLLQVGEEFWSVAKTTKLNSGIKGDDGKEQLLEFRWDGCQSVLPPSMHPLTGQYQWVVSPDESAIADCPMWVIELILNGEKEQDQPTLPQQSHRYEQITVPVPASVPLEVCLGKESRNLLNGVAEPGRNDAGAKLTRDLIGTANYLRSVGQAFDGDPWLSFQDFAARCNPPLDAHEQSKIWESAEGDRPTPSCKEEGVNNCVIGWYRRTHKPNQSPQPTKAAPTARGNVVAFPGFSKPPLAPIVREEIAKNPTAEEKREAIRQIEAATGYHIKEVEREWREQVRQQQEAEELTETRRSLNKLLKQDRLNPFDYLWGDGGRLAHALTQTAEAMPAAPGLLFTALLPTSAACIGTAARVIVKPKAKYTQPCIFWTVGLGRSGQLKTPTQSIVIEPLVDLEIAAAEAYTRAEEIYKAELAEWKKDKAGDVEAPTQPKRKRYLTTDATVESLERVHAENPRGLFVFTDELAGEFKAENAHRSGKGADREKKLTQWNGSAIVVDRKERTVALKRSAINRTGGCQWDVWAELMGSGDDSNGFFCRWLICGEESPRRYINFSAGTADTGIGDLLKNLYQALEQLPEADYLLSTDAQRIFEPWQHYLVDLEAAAKTSALANLYPKIEAYTSRFALWLHLVNAVLAGERPDPVISGETMERAIALAKYYLNQAESILLTYSPQAGLTGILKQIQDYAAKKPDGVKPGKLSAGIKTIRKKIEARELTVEDLYHHCQQLATDGYGTFVNGVYKAVDRQLTGVDRRSTGTKNAETTVNQHYGNLAVDQQLTGVDRRSTVETKQYQPIGVKNTSPVDQLTENGDQISTTPKTSPKTSTSSGQLVNQVNQQSTSAVKNPVEQAVDPVDHAVNQQSTSSQPGQLKVGDRVAHVDPEEDSYNWRGEIVKIYPNKLGEWMADVCWPERTKLKIRGGEVVSGRLSRLRKLD